jgi:hypothetical protein
MACGQQEHIALRHNDAPTDLWQASSPRIYLQRPAIRHSHLVDTNAFGGYLDCVARDSGDLLAESLNAARTRPAAEVPTLPGERAERHWEAHDNNRAAQWRRVYSVIQAKWKTRTEIKPEPQHVGDFRQPSREIRRRADSWRAGPLSAHGHGRIGVADQVRADAPRQP